MSEHTTETVIANQAETIRRLIEERDALKRKVESLEATVEDWKKWARELA